MDMLVQHFKKVLAVVGLMLAMVSCTHCYKIDGVVETFGYEGRELSLVEFLPFRTTRIDSCIVSHGKFHMKGRVDTTRLVFLCKDNRPIIPLYLEKGRTDVRLLPTEMTASGTRQNDLFYSFLKKKIDIDNRFEEMSQKRISMSRSGIDLRKMELIQDSLRIIVNECEEMICSFMEANYREPAAIGVFMMLSVSPTDEISSLIKRILDAAPDDFLAQSYVSGYTHRVGYDRN